MFRQQKSCAVLAVLLSASAVAGRRWLPTRCELPGRDIPDGKSVGKAPSLESKTKFAVIGVLMSDPALEVVDQITEIQFGFTAQPIVLAGCGPPPRGHRRCSERQQELR